MTTAVSIILYAAACFMGAVIGVMGAENKEGKITKAQAEFSICAFLVFFALAASLQVFA